jgi:GntR family transcriptional regulator
MLVSTSHKHVHSAVALEAAAEPAITGLNARSPVPLYSQLRELLRRRIADGVYKSHQQMPSENEMVALFGVSRITIRQALNDLQKEGLIFKIHGKGTFVSKTKAVHSLTRLQGLGEALSGSGHQIQSRVLGHRILRADQQVAARLALSERDEVMEIRRVRLADSEPISYDITYLPQALGHRVVREDLQRRDIFAILESDFGMVLGNAELHIEAVTADAVVADALGLASGAAVLRIQRLTYTANHVPLDFEFLFYRGDAFQYHIELERQTRQVGASRLTGVAPAAKPVKTK